MVFHAIYKKKRIAWQLFCCLEAKLQFVAFKSLFHLFFSFLVHWWEQSLYANIYTIELQTWSQYSHLIAKYTEFVGATMSPTAYWTVANFKYTNFWYVSEASDHCCNALN